MKLTDKEKEDILYLNNKFKKFMLVLNVGGVVDLSDVLEVSNILLLSQLGVVTGDVLVDIQKTITKFENLIGNFDKVRIADPEEYRVFKDSSGNHCNFGDL